MYRQLKTFFNGIALVDVLIEFVIGEKASLASADKQLCCFGAWIQNSETTTRRNMHPTQGPYPTSSFHKERT